MLSIKSRKISQVLGVLSAFYVIVSAFWGCNPKVATYTFPNKKIKGVAFVAPRDSLEVSSYHPVKRVNAEWVALMPYGYTREGTADFVYAQDSDWHWWGESPSGVAHCVRAAHAQGLKVMLKPHMWAGRGSFTGHFDLATEAEWLTFEKGFASYLLEFARVAHSTDVELYCIATEMQTFVKQRPQFWFQLIRDIKKIYQGQLTYAENWDAYQEVPFWHELDFVGIDAYFPLSEEQSPKLEELKKGWKPHLKALEKYSAKTQKPILFTEFGYVSSDFAARRPWEAERNRPENQALQARAYEAFFEETWPQGWLAGGFVWKWFPSLGKGELARDPFSPQNKEGELVLGRYFSILNE